MSGARIVQQIPSLDLYRELEVDPAATAETIDAAWKSLMKRHHPDVAAGPGAPLERVKRLNLAHEWLGDPRRRALYDRSRRRPRVLVFGRPDGRPGIPRARHRTPVTLSHEAARDTAAARAGGSTQASRTAVPATGGQRSSRVQTMLVSGLLATVLTIVAISSYLTSIRSAPTTGSTSGLSEGEGGGSPSVVRGSLTAAAAGSAMSRGVDPRALAPPNLAAELPGSCRGADVSQAFSFETQVGQGPAKVFVVRCDATRSFGPLVYVPASDGWRLKSKGGLQEGYAYRAFSGAISGRSADEFGIAWTSGDGTRSSVVLYRVADRLQAFWDSSSIGLAWSLATFTWQARPDPAAAGFLIVVEADLATGTANCATCKDHQLYRSFYVWDPSRPTPELRQTAREPYGLGPP